MKATIGASGLQAADHKFNTAPKDGTEIAAVHGHIPTLPIYKDEGVRFDPLKFGWIGSVIKDTFIANAVIGTKFKIITGYEGSAGTTLAVERANSELYHEPSGRGVEHHGSSDRSPTWLCSSGWAVSAPDDPLRCLQT